MVKVKSKPLLVYLDYNVIVSLQDGDITTDQIKQKVGTKNVIFPYSASHIEEVKNIKDRPGLPRYNTIDERLKFINALTKRQYLERIEFDRPYKKRSVSAFVVYDTINEVPNVELHYKALSNLLSEEFKQAYRDKLGLDSVTLNNVKPSEIINHLNSKFLLDQHKMSIKEMLEQSQTFYPSTYKWGIESNIAGLFAILDLMGYWKDKYNENSNVARYWDSSHCGLASFCDVLVSQDAKMRLKSEVAYDMFNVKTKIISPT